MATEVWIRNPRLCIKECLEVGVENFVWDRGLLRKFKIEPSKFLNLYYGQALPWRSIAVGVQGCTEYTSESPDKPVACYPTWEYTDDLDSLVDMILNPAGEDPDAYHDPDDPPDLRPVEGQEHRILITNTPSATTGLGKQFYRTLSEVQEEYPNVNLHVHGLYSFRIMFGLGYRSVDFEPRDTAAHGKVMMPVGKELTHAKAAEYPKWIKMLGFRPVELKIPRNRCMFNIASAGWAGKHFNDEIRWSLNKNRASFDPDAPFVEGATDSRIMLRNVKPVSADKWLCDTCSLQLDCKFFREGAVCAVPDSEPLELSAFFKTRDSDKIIDGLGTLLATQSHRLNRALREEEKSYEDDGTGVGGSVDPELTKIINSLYDRAIKLAKLVDPSLRAGPKVSINSNNNTGIISGASPAALMAAVVEELTKRGVKREDITPEMVMGIVATPEETRQRAIEAAVVNTADDDTYDVDSWEVE